VIERIENPSPELFYRSFVRPNRPVVITGVADKWPAIERWSPEYFRSSFPQARVIFTAWESDNSSNDPADYYEKRRKLGTRLGSFIDFMNAEKDFSRNYITQFPVFREIPELLEDIHQPDVLMSVPTYAPTALRSRLKKEPTMWLGPAQTVTPIHFDGADNLLVQIYGRKKLTLVAPAESDCLYYPCLRLGHVHYSPVDVEEPDLERFPKYAKATPLEVTLEPGEMLFIPVRWWHHARSLEKAISLNFWWFSLRSLLRMRHPYFVYQKHRGLRRLLNPTRK
jgi:lysine-specific demethylase 8